MSSHFSVHPREGGNPVLWAMGNTAFALTVILRTATAAKTWVPAFAGMHGKMGAHAVTFRLPLTASLSRRSNRDSNPPSAITNGPRKISLAHGL